MPREIKRKIHEYTEDALKAALTAIRDDKMGIREASRQFGVPRGTIQDRLHGRVKEGPRKMGPPTVLTGEEESKLVLWIVELAKCGFPRKKHDLLNTVQQIVVSQGRQTVFNDGRPGDKWYRSFLKRHPELTYKEAEGISMARGIITEESIRKWFMELKQYLEEQNVADLLNDPDRIVNGDETSFCMCPKTGKVLAPRGWKNLYEVKKGSDKEAITVLLVFSASGKTVNPMVVFPYVRPPKSVVDSMPSGWFLGRSETGWMRSEVFYEYIANGFHNWLNEQKIPRPVLLLIDGHKSHLSMQLSQFCSDNQIILYALPPNTTHIMQPADVGVFKPLKTEWKKTLRNWQAKPENTNSVLTKSTFCPLLNEVLKGDITKSIVNGFRKCGLYPFNPDAVDYTKCVQNTLENINIRTTDTANNKVQISLQEFQITENVLTKLEQKLEEKYVNGEINNIIKDIRRLKEQSFPATDTATCSTIAESENYEVDADGMLERVTHDPNIIFEQQNEPEILVTGCELVNFMTDLESSQISLEEPSHTIIEFDVQNDESKNEIRLEENNNVTGRVTKNETDETKTDSIEKINIIQNICINNKTDYTQPIMISSKNNEGNLTLNDGTDILNLNRERNEAVILLDTETENTNNLKSISINKENNNNLQNILQKEEHEKQIEKDPFGKHLFWQTPLKSGGKRKSSAEKAPAAISSESFRNYLRIKEEKKQKEEDEKQKRKAERLKRITQNKLEKEKKIKRRKLSKKDSNDKEDQQRTQPRTKPKEICAGCDCEMDSDTEENDLKNLGCDKCPRWFHLKCTGFFGRQYEEIADINFLCPFC